jgi:hypothetical protein
MRRMQCHRIPARAAGAGIRRRQVVSALRKIIFCAQPINAALTLFNQPANKNDQYQR